MTYIAYLQTQRGTLEAQIWRDLDCCEPYYSAAAPRGLMHHRFIAKHKVSEQHEGLSVDELTKLYPPPQQATAA